MFIISSQAKKVNYMIISGYVFETPQLLSRIDLIDRAAVYVILDKRSNGEYYVVYVGETGQAGTRLANHERSECWNNASSGTLYVAIKWTPAGGYTVDGRREIEKAIRDEYDPSCNRQ